MSTSSSSSSRSSSSPPPASKRKRVTEDNAIDEEESDEESSSDSEDGSEVQEVEDDVPPLSHAEKRRQKKKQKLADKQGKGPASKKRKLADGSSSSSSAPNRQNSVWVGNMSFKTTPDALRTFFEGVGEITRIHMPMKFVSRPGGLGENRGFAYVDFATSDGKAVAITMSEKPLNGRKLLIKDGDDFTGRPTQATENIAEDATKGRTSLSKTSQKILKLQKQPPAPTLFFGNLSFETTEDMIRELLNAHKEKPTKRGEPEEESKKSGDSKETEDWIRRIRLGQFEDSGKCKGFAFVDFSSTEYATSALINPRNHRLNGRQLVVEYASTDAVRRGASKDLLPGAKGDAKERSHKSKPAHNRGAPRRMEPHREVEAPTKAENQSSQAESEHTGRRKNSDTNAPKQKGPRHRPKPGAALAQAKRQSAAIVPTEAKKIVF
ncbi:Nucleolar protein 13 [Paramarasmius palmivorus]|uniref:Nucleolar protein 13 n=1 Tax=Paramarasmius palmivorus TaxID=297713 RepID=A0AAW0C432_9AGAR